METKVTILPLGAGQEVGRSCIFVSFNNERSFLLDCGVHMGHHDRKKYPNFEFLRKELKVESLNSKIDAILLSHFHLDHCASLPFLVETEEFSNPIITSEPTRAILPYMLKDFARVTKDKIFQCNEKHVNKVMSLVETLGLGEERIINGVKIKMFYAGHVLGAVMFLMEYKGVRVLYTGDFNSAADRHLGSLNVEKCWPHVVITESTYATVMKQWKKQREMQFMALAKRTLERGGKVLIPVFALGRAQELMILIDDLWSKTGWQVPVFYSGGLVDRVQFYYRLFLPWTNENLKRSGYTDSKRLSGFTRFRKIVPGQTKAEGPMVILATPGMLHAGKSLELFKELCGDERNSLLIPGYCVKGTFGERLLSGQKELYIHDKKYTVRMEVAKMSFSAHADSKGITDLIEYLEPQHTVFVHGDKSRMFGLADHLSEKKGYNCHCPANHQRLDIKLKVGGFCEMKKEMERFPVMLDINGMEMKSGIWKIREKSGEIEVLEVKEKVNTIVVKRKR
jgi:integrator complex subunit 11